MNYTSEVSVNRLANSNNNDQIKKNSFTCVQLYLLLSLSL